MTKKLLGFLMIFISGIIFYRYANSHDYWIGVLNLFMLSGSSYFLDSKQKEQDSK